MVARGNKLCKNRQNLYKILCGKIYCTRHYNQLKLQIFASLPVEIIEIIMKRAVDMESNARIPVETIFNFALCSKFLNKIFWNIRMYVIRRIPILKSINSGISLLEMLSIELCSSENVGILEYMRKVEKCNALSCYTYFSDNIDEVLDLFDPLDRDTFENGFDVEGDGFFSEPHSNKGQFTLSSTQILDVDLCSVKYKTFEVVIEFSEKNILVLIMNKNTTGYYSIYTNAYKIDLKPGEEASQCYFDCDSGKETCPYKDRHFYDNCPGSYDIFSVSIAVDISPLDTPYAKSEELFCENANDIAYTLNTITNSRICKICP